MTSMAIMAHYYYYYYYLLQVFNTSIYWWCFKGIWVTQVSMTVLNILDNLSTVIVWTVSACPPISTSSSLLIKPLKIVSSAPVTICITFNRIFRSLFSSLAISFYFFKSFHTSVIIIINVVVWMVSTHPPTSTSSSPFSNPLVTDQNAPITIGIIVTCMFHSFFNSLARSRYLFFFSHSFSFILWSAGKAESTILQVLFFLLIIIRSGLLAEIRWSVCMSKSHWSLCVLFSRTGTGLCIYHLFFMVKFKLFAHLSVDHLADSVMSSFIFLLR